MKACVLTGAGGAIGGAIARMLTASGWRVLGIDLAFPDDKASSLSERVVCDITDEAKLRTSACVTVPAGTEGSGEVGTMTVAGGKYAVGRFELRTDQYPEAWAALMGAWLPQSGYQPDDNPCFERYICGPEEHPEGMCVTEICVPVKPL